MSANAKDQAPSLKAPLLALKASAGSGKTFALAMRYIILLFQGARAHEILAITFTKKATKEMQERIQNALYDLAHSKQGAIYQSLLTQGFSAQEIARNAPRIYQAFLHDRARILTIDALFTMMLKKFSYFAGLRADFTMINDGQSVQDTIKELFLESSARFDSLESLASVCMQLGLEFASLLGFMQQCFEDRIHFSQALLARYRKLDPATLLERAKAKQERVMSLLQEMRQILVDAGEQLNAPLSTKGYNALSFASFEDFLTKKDITWLVKDEPKEYDYFKKILKKDAAVDAQICERVSELKQCVCEIFTLQERATLSHIARMITRYAGARKSALCKSNMLSFSDCMLELYGLLVQGVQESSLESNNDAQGNHQGEHSQGAVIGSSFFYFRLDTTITHILIDEFQDTSPIQYRILQPLIDEICAGFGVRGKEHRSFFIVGDSKQSIYGFRGSESGFFDKVAGELGLNVQNLPYNYRSYSEIISFVNAVFAEVFSDYIPQQLPQQSDKLGGFVRVSLLQIPNPKTGKLATSKQDIEPAMLDYALRTLEELLESSVSAEDIAFLCFKNDEAATLRNAIKSRFPELNIVLNARAKITDEISVKILLCALRLVAYIRVAELESKLDSSALLADSGARFYLYELAKLLGEMAFTTEEVQGIAQGFIEAFSSCAHESAPSPYLLAFMHKFATWDKAAQLLLEYSIEASSIEELFTMLEVSTPDAPNDNQQGLQILTIHKSKGLEFPYVVVLDRFSKKKPDSAQILHTQDKEILLRLEGRDKRRKELDENYKRARELREVQATIEENNVLYVACTRAQKGLVIVAKATNDDSSAFNVILRHLPANASAQKSSLESSQTSTMDSSSLESNLAESKLESNKLESSAPSSSNGTYSVEVLLDSGAVLPSLHKEPKPAHCPIVLTQEHFGKQDFPTTSAQESLALDVASMRFGSALHLALEYRLGFGVERERIVEILRYHFGLESSALGEIISRLAALECDSRLLDLQQRARKDGVVRLFTEVPLFTDSALKRLDVLGICASEKGDKEAFVVIDYKSGKPKEQHLEQVQGYLQALRSVYGSSMEYEGYVAYIRDSISWVAHKGE